MNTYYSMYSRTFQAFLSQTDEKAELLRAIKARIKSCNCHSLLDIGAGGGELAVPLSKSVEHYVAIERSRIFADRLQAAGIHVINSSFPLLISHTFDVVLACHSVPRRPIHFVPFIEGALRCVSENGQFLLITHDDRGGAWEELLHACALTWQERQKDRFFELWNLLNGRGKTTLSEITTHVRAKSIDDIMHALSFMFANGSGMNGMRFISNSQVRSYLRERHLHRGGYAFPVKHVMIELGRLDPPSP